ncbi:MAG: MerR family transcriptional regulator [bacterium]
MAQLLTLKEIAKKINIPESSLRKYREIFEDFVPGVGSGRGRRYREEATGIFRDIRTWRENEHMPWEAITSRLAEKYPINAPTAATEKAAPKPAPPRTAPQPAAPQPTQAPAPVSSQDPRFEAARYLRRITSLGEKQIDILNSIGAEVMNFVQNNQRLTVNEVRKMTNRLNTSFQTLTSVVMTSVREQSKMLNDMQNRIAALEANHRELVKGGVKSIQVAEVKEKILAMRRKIEGRDRVIEEFKRSFEVIKRENSELRAFKMRHMDKAEDKIREIKAYRKTPLWKRITGSKF